MGWSRHHKIGLIHYNPQQSYRGYTLVATNRGGYHANLIDMEGRVCHRWYHPEGITYGYLLPNGNLFFRSRTAQGEGEGPSFGGRSLSLIELDWDGNVVWQYRPTDMYLHHDFERLLNGNTLALLWAPIPAELSAQVQGGFVADDDPVEMWGDVVREITPAGEVVYEWKSWEFLKVEEDVICPLEGRKEWSHQNALNVTSEGDLLVSYRQTSTVGIVDKASGEFRWKWGAGPGLSPAPPHLPGKRTGDAVRQRQPPAGRQPLPDYRGGPGDQPDWLGIPGHPGHFLFQL